MLETFLSGARTDAVMSSSFRRPHENSKNLHSEERFRNVS